MMHEGWDRTRRRLACLELSQLCLDFLDISSVPFSDPSLSAGAPHFSVADGHAAAVPGCNCWSRSERGGAVSQGGEYEFGWDSFAEGTVDLVDLLTFCIRFLFLMEEGVGGRGHWTHEEAIDAWSYGGGEWTELGFSDTVVIRGDYDGVKVKDERRGTPGILGAARHRCGVGRGQIQRR